MKKIIVILSLFAIDVSGWGHAGHRDITYKALEALCDDVIARKYLRDHLGGPEAIVRASEWADTKEAISKYPGSEDLHFCNTPWRKCGAFNITRDCGFGGSGECIVTGIADMALIAVDPTASKEDRIDALKFLLHLLADIHQPLHTGFAEDNGGGNIQLNSEPVMSLHQMWDYGLLEQEDDAGGAETVPPPAVHEEASIHVPELIEWREHMLVFASNLATESSTLLTCRYAYRDDRGRYIQSKDRLSASYMASRKTIAKQRIELAARRLADLLSSVARTFTANSMSASAEEASTKVSFVSTNRFADLAIELEPDDLVEESALVIEAVRSSSSSPKRKKKAARIGLEQYIPESAPARIGDVDLADIVLLKIHERYWLTCTRLLKDHPDYEPMHAIPFRVRFTKNKRRTDPILFLADLDCFGHHMGQTELSNALYYMSGHVGSMIPASAGSTAVSVTSDGGKDILDIYPVYEEYSSRITEGIAAGRFVRAWSPMYQGDHTPSMAYIDYLRATHLTKQHDAIDEANRMKIPLDAKWDRDFFTKLSSIRLYRFGQLQVLVHTDTLTNRDLFEFRFAMYPCISRSESLDDPHFTTMIDTTIYDGAMTPRIVKGIGSLVAKQGLNPDDMYKQRPTFLSELEDVEKILYGQGKGRVHSLKVIQGYYMYPSIITNIMSYFEWTTVPYMFQPIIADVESAEETSL